jgi:hypothetical protein
VIDDEPPYLIDDEPPYLSFVSGDGIRRLVESPDVIDTLGSLMRLGYERHMAPPWLKLLQVLLLSYDRRVDSRARTRMKSRLSKDLPKCFLRPLYAPGRRERGRPREQAAQNRELIQRVYPKLTALYDTRPTLRDVEGLLTANGITIRRQRVHDIKDIIETPRTASFDRARDTLAVAFDAGRGTIDKALVRRNWTNNLSEAAFRRWEARSPLPLTWE